MATVEKLSIALDHDEFGLNQSKLIVIDYEYLERDAGGKSLRAFPHPALTLEFASDIRQAVLSGE